MTNENTYTVAVNLENIDSGLITLHQATFLCGNRWEAIGRGVEKFMEIEGGAIHSYKVNLVNAGEDDISEYIELIERGLKIQAIKLRRENTGDGLKDSKEWIDDLIVRYDIQVKYNNG